MYVNTIDITIQYIKHNKTPTINAKERMSQRQRQSTIVKRREYSSLSINEIPNNKFRTRGMYEYNHRLDGDTRKPVFSVSKRLLVHYCYVCAI